MKYRAYPVECGWCGACSGVVTWGHARVTSRAADAALPSPPEHGRSWTDSLHRCDEMLTSGNAPQPLPSYCPWIRTFEGADGAATFDSVTVTVCPAMVSVPVREVPVEFVATV